jgi:hypothetical protein
MALANFLPQTASILNAKVFRKYASLKLIRNATLGDFFSI